MESVIEQLDSEYIRKMARLVLDSPDHEDHYKELNQSMASLTYMERLALEDNLVALGARFDLLFAEQIHYTRICKAVDTDFSHLSADHLIQCLHQDHLLYLSHLDKLETLCNSMDFKIGSSISDPLLEELRMIAQKFIESDGHHDREEQTVIAALKVFKMPKPAETTRLEHKHLKMRKKKILGLITVLQGNAHKRDQALLLRATIKNLVTLMRCHIAKEDNILFPLALKVIPEDQWGNMSMRFHELLKES